MVLLQSLSAMPLDKPRNLPGHQSGALSSWPQLSCQAETGEGRLSWPWQLAREKGAWSGPQEEEGVTT